VLSVPKRVRWHLREKPELIGGLLPIFLRAVKTKLRQRSPSAPPGARFGAVAFVHRFGSYLNSHVHFHVLVTDGVFSGDDGGAEFHPATGLDTDDIVAVQAKIRHRGLRWLHRHGHLDDLAVHTMDSADHAGGWSVDAQVEIPDWDRHGLKRLVRYCGVLAPDANLRAAVTASAGPAGATQQVIEQARLKTGLNPPDSTERPTLECRRDRNRERRCRAVLLAAEAESRLSARNRASRGCWRP
jgi:hypothetical protein